MLDHTAEEWRPVYGHEDRYEVSNLGRVRSLPGGRRHAKLLKPMRRHKGHLAVRLHTGPDTPGRWPFKNAFIHALVLEAFIAPRPEGMVCRHLNGNPADNRVENLAWGTHSDNVQDMLSHGTNKKASQTECLNGHKFTPDDIRVRSNRSNSRECRECNRQRCRARYARVRADRKSAP